MSITPFLVTGCGRSGTQYVASLLAAMGLRVRHEHVFVPNHIEGQTKATMTGLMQKMEVDGSVSWFAVSYLDLVPDDWKIIHLVRNPVNAIRSWVAHGFWPLGIDWGGVGLVAKRLGWPPRNLHCNLECSVAYWIGWNGIIEQLGRNRPIRRVRLEDLSANFQSVLSLMDYLGHSVDSVSAATIHENQPRDVGATKFMKSEGNYRYSAPLDFSITWERLGAAYRNRLRAMAEEYGYTENDLENA